MNEQEFNVKYNEAIIKVAIGFYILDTCGEALNYTPEIIEGNKFTLSAILAGGINIPAATVFSDANIAGNHFTASYIDTLHRSGLMDDLVTEMQTLKLI